MKSFLKTVFASFTALFIFLLLLVILVGVALTGKDLPQPIEDNTLLVLNLSVPIVDRQPRQRLSKVLGSAVFEQEESRQSLRAVVTAIRKAANDDHISGLYLKGHVVRDGYASGWAALKEVREAIVAFKKSGKPVISWQENLDEATLYVVSPADELVLNPLGMMEFNGFASEVMYYRNAFEKYGIDVQVSRVGKYKSAVEPYLLDHMSDENREQLNVLLNDLFDEVIVAVAESRSVSAADVRALSQKQGFVDAQLALKQGYVSAVDYYDVVLKKLRDITDTEEGEDVTRLASVSGYFSTVAPKADEDKKKVVVIYAEGEIVSGKSKEKVGGDYIASLLRKAREDDEVKAVVLRVNSPGGSASASDIIQRETVLLGKEKPLIVSMGAVAASGGYWISAYADKIYAEPNTITGSIGVFGMFLNIQKLINEFGLKVEVAQTTSSADMFSLYRPKTAVEMATLQKFIDEIYSQFLKKVSEGRKLSVEQVHDIAQGRVWSGKQALKLGLVDELGGLREAVAFAAEQAQLDDYAIEEYQKEGSFMDELLKEMGMESSVAPVSALQPLWNQLQSLLVLTDSKGTYARLPYDVFVH